MSIVPSSEQIDAAQQTIIDAASKAAERTEIRDLVRGLSPNEMRGAESIRLFENREPTAEDLRRIKAQAAGGRVWR
ncbi:MAG: hypothetical protein WDN69_05060 [Aliidongia sp.]